jgi:ABC-type polar amino acid transport system ATPase subunit
MSETEQAVELLVRLGYNQTLDPQNYEEVKWAVIRSLELAVARQYAEAKEKTRALDPGLRQEVLARIDRIESDDEGGDLPPLKDEPGVII